MSKLVWDKTGERQYENGVDRGVLYLFENGAYGNGTVWNGLTAVNESPSGAEASALYADNNVYKQSNVYEIIVIDEDPDSELVKKISTLPMCKFNRHYESDRLNHDVFTLHY